MLAGAVLYFTYLIASHRGLPNVLVIMTVLIALYGFVTRRTSIGRQIYAVGGNAKAAKLSGIKTERLTFLTFVNMGVWLRSPGWYLPRASTRQRPRPAPASSSTSSPPASLAVPRLTAVSAGSAVRWSEP